MDYKTPIEIEDFQFKPLKNRNLFSGPEADFFNEKHPFNKKFTDEIELDFIFGNPPWGEVKKSCYIDYIKNRNKKELQKNKKNNIKLMIGNNEISQAFLVRTSDFIQPEQNTKCVFIVIK